MIGFTETGSIPNARGFGSGSRLPWSDNRLCQRTGVQIFRNRTRKTEALKRGFFASQELEAIVVHAVKMKLRQSTITPRPHSPKPVKQPVEFSHKRHAELGLECKVCHPMTDGEQAGIPQTADCMNCHQSSDGSKAAFRSLFEHAEAKKQILWTRVLSTPLFCVLRTRSPSEAPRMDVKRVTA